MAITMRSNQTSLEQKFDKLTAETAAGAKFQQQQQQELSSMLSNFMAEFRESQAKTAQTAFQSQKLRPNPYASPHENQFVLASASLPYSNGTQRKPFAGGKDFLSIPHTFMNRKYLTFDSQPAISSLFFVEPTNSNPEAGRLPQEMSVKIMKAIVEASRQCGPNTQCPPKIIPMEHGNKILVQAFSPNDVVPLMENLRLPTGFRCAKSLREKKTSTLTRNWIHQANHRNRKTGNCTRDYPREFCSP